MNIVIGYPPNIEKIRKVFPDVDKYPLCICYGDTIYNPQRIQLKDHHIYHESIHSRQQGDDPEGFCDRYMADIDFRIDSEAEAYAAELKFIEKERGHQSPTHLTHFSRALSGPAYGGVISEERARQKILEYLRTSL